MMELVGFFIVLLIFILGLPLYIWRRGQNLPDLGTQNCSKCGEKPREYAKNFCPGGVACYMLTGGEHFHRWCECGYTWAEKLE